MLDDLGGHILIFEPQVPDPGESNLDQDQRNAHHPEPTLDLDAESVQT